ncbi:MAG: hypothetical protein RBR41_02345 [Desulfovibrio sp.]|uniref:hypothetical protein n=1 Tax=Desulfovibrio sp. TaxID=885 RepID=UPI002A36DA0C|nr:hypothetical protein [Desulfovibrio sp.]MDY0258491.1 hypothetical protein [Desulfovibrio sp.]
MKVIFFLIGVGIIALWLWSGGLTELSKENGKNVESIESLFTGLAFLGMMVAIYFQNEELKLQRQELSETREELKRSADANTESALLAKNNIEQQYYIAKSNFYTLKTHYLLRNILRRLTIFINQ